MICPRWIVGAGCEQPKASSGEIFADDDDFDSNSSKYERYVASYEEKSLKLEQYVIT